MHRMVTSDFVVRHTFILTWVLIFKKTLPYLIFEWSKVFHFTLLFLINRSSIIREVSAWIAIFSNCGLSIVKNIVALMRSIALRSFNDRLLLVLILVFLLLFLFFFVNISALSLRNIFPSAGIVSAILCDIWISLVCKSFSQGCLRGSGIWSCCKVRRCLTSDGWFEKGCWLTHLIMKDGIWG